MNRSVKTQGIKTTKLQSLAKEETFCKYTHRTCMQNCVDGLDYCIRHILEDKAAPFKQCTYMTKSGKRCLTAAPKHERKDGYCTEHAKKAFITRQRLSRKRRPKESTETLLDELTSVNSGATDVHTNENRRSKAHSDSIASKALEYASSSDSEAEALLVEKTWRDPGDSDAESIDSDQEDMLKYAGIYTTEEVAQILRDKLIRLQTLYIDQFKRLKHVLLSKRRQYLQAYKVEKETLGSIKLYKNDPFQKDKYDKLCALKRYHKKYGKEALLQKQSTERRMQSTEEANYAPPHFVKCVFVDEGWRCGSRVVPLSKFCQKPNDNIDFMCPEPCQDILHDSAQVLYRPCPFADSQCGRPVPTIFNTEYCSLHQPVPPLQEVDHLSVDDSSLQTEDIDISKLTAEESKESFLHSSDSSNSNKLSSTSVKTEVDPDSHIKTEVPEASSNVPAPDTGEENHRPRGILFTLGEEAEEEDGQAR